jgi:hypothetical protein
VESFRHRPSSTDWTGGSRSDPALPETMPRWPKHAPHRVDAPIEYLPHAMLRQAG